MGIDYSSNLLLGWDLNEFPFFMMFKTEFDESFEDWVWRNNDDDFPFEHFSESGWKKTRGYFGIELSSSRLDYQARKRTLKGFSAELDKAIQSMKKLLEHPQITSEGKRWLQDNPPKIIHYVYMW